MMRAQTLCLVLVAFSSSVAPAGVLAQAAPLQDFAWLADGRRFTIGDIITVVVDEYTAASADRVTTAQENRRTDAGLGARGGGMVAEGTVGGFLGNESLRRGRDSRQDRLTSEVSVRVTDVETGGGLRVEGTKLVTIDDHEQEVTVRGIIRPQDITSMNTVESWRIAEVEVLYSTEGDLGKAKKGILSRLLGFIIP
jgi:flagellar L-ring protein FlgH